MRKTQRCEWAKAEPSIAYHDTEWGVPLHDDRALFEFLVLEGAQAGLSWETILKKRDNFRVAFDNFDPRVVAKYDRPRPQRSQRLANSHDWKRSGFRPTRSGASAPSRRIVRWSVETCSRITT